MKRYPAVLVPALATLGMLSCGTASAMPEPVADFRFDRGLGDCRVDNYRNLLTVTTEEVLGEPAFVIANPEARERDNAWHLETGPFPVSGEREFAILVRAHGDFKMVGTLPPSRIAWFGKDGKPLETTDALNHRIPLVTAIGFAPGLTGWHSGLVRGEVPSAAATARIRIGSDNPDLLKGQRLCVSRIAYFERGPGRDWDFGDMDPPELEMLTPSPCAELSAPLRFRLRDDSPLDMAKFRCRLDGVDIAGALSRDGNEFSYRPPAPWKAGSFHELVVDCADAAGNEGADSGCVSFDVRRPVHPVASLRDDGTVLLDGRPFFPIGIYGVMASPLHGNDLDRSVRELKAGGVNLIGTYLVGNGILDTPSYEQLVAACDRHGLRFWAQPAGTHSKGGPKAIFANVGAGLGHPSAFMWENGDDTAFHRTPGQVKADHLACHAVDPAILTSSADISPERGRVVPYARYADVFKSENYPIRKATPQPGEFAEMARDLANAAEDLRRGGANPPCLFSIVQSFVGWGWERYPTCEELRGMTYLAVACGVRGVTYYTYFSKNGEGVASSETRFAEFTRVTKELASYGRHLVARDAKVQPKAEILEGPAVAAYGRPAVAFLLKETGFFVAVNVASEPIGVKFTFPDGTKLEQRLERCGVLIRIAGEAGNQP